MRLRVQARRCLELPRDREPQYVGHGKAFPSRRSLERGSESVFVYSQTPRCTLGVRAFGSSGGCDRVPTKPDDFALVTSFHEVHRCVMEVFAGPFLVVISPVDHNRQFVQRIPLFGSMRVRGKLDIRPIQ